MRSLALAASLLACIICMLACAKASTKGPIAEGCGPTSGVESDSGCICESCASLKAQSSFPLLSAQGYSLPHNWGKYDLSNITARFSNPQAQVLLFGSRFVIPSSHDRRSPTDLSPLPKHHWPQHPLCLNSTFSNEQKGLQTIFGTW